jgi:hypothetical protein
MFGRTLAWYIAREPGFEHRMTSIVRASGHSQRRNLGSRRALKLGAFLGVSLGLPLVGCGEVERCYDCHSHPATTLGAGDAGEASSGTSARGESGEAALGPAVLVARVGSRVIAHRASRSRAEPEERIVTRAARALPAALREQEAAGAASPRVGR